MFTSPNYDCSEDMKVITKLEKQLQQMHSQINQNARKHKDLFLKQSYVYNLGKDMEEKKDLLKYEINDLKKIELQKDLATMQQQFDDYLTAKNIEKTFNYTYLEDGADIEEQVLHKNLEALAYDDLGVEWHYHHRSGFSVLGGL